MDSSVVRVVCVAPCGGVAAEDEGEDGDSGSRRAEPRVSSFRGGAKAQAEKVVDESEEGTRRCSASAGEREIAEDGEHELEARQGPGKQRGLGHDVALAGR